MRGEYNGMKDAYYGRGTGIGGLMREEIDLR